eukprot:1158767-Rhodomonas_salina.1
MLLLCTTTAHIFRRRQSSLCGHVRRINECGGNEGGQWRRMLKRKDQARSDGEKERAGRSRVDMWDGPEIFLVRDLCELWLGGIEAERHEHFWCHVRFEDERARFQAVRGVEEEWLLVLLPLKEALECCLARRKLGVAIQGGGRDSRCAQVVCSLDEHPVHSVGNRNTLHHERLATIEKIRKIACHLSANGYNAAD